MDILATLKEAQSELAKRLSAQFDTELDYAQKELTEVIDGYQADAPMPPHQIGNLANAEDGLNCWLVDNTDEVFEEEPAVDNARGLLDDVLHELRKLAS